MPLLLPSPNQSLLWTRHLTTRPDWCLSQSRKSTDSTFPDSSIFLLGSGPAYLPFREWSISFASTRPASCSRGFWPYKSMFFNGHPDWLFFFHTHPPPWPSRPQRPPPCKFPPPVACASSRCPSVLPLPHHLLSHSALPLGIRRHIVVRKAEAFLKLLTPSQLWSGQP